MESRGYVTRLKVTDGIWIGVTASMSGNKVLFADADGLELTEAEIEELSLNYSISDLPVG